MFSWFKKKKELPLKDDLFSEPDIHDAIEESLWEIKEEYDLPTEEVVGVVYSKRKNLDYMREMISKNKENT